MTGMDVRPSSVRLDEDGVRLLPSRAQRWRGVGEVSIPYARIAGLTMTEPQGLVPGTLTVRLRDNGDACTFSFGPFQLREMRRTYAELWARVSAARDEDSATGR